MGDGVLLTGDLERDGVSALLKAGCPGPVTLLKLPHHGSGGSGSERLIRRFAPQGACVSVGHENPFHLPHRDLMAELERRAIPVWRTDRDGTVRFEVEEGGWRAKVWNRGYFH